MKYSLVRTKTVRI